MNNWEYKTCTLDTVDDINFVNDMAFDGWELINVIHLTRYSSVYWFKREKDKNKRIENMKKSEIKTMADTFVGKFRNVSEIEKSYLWEGYIMGAMEMLYKLGIEVTVDTEE